MEFRQVLALIFYIFICTCNSKTPSSINVTEDIIDLSNLSTLKAFGNHTYNEQSTNYLVAIYIADVSCDSCKIKAVKEMARLHRDMNDLTDFILVSFGAFPGDLRNIRRISKVDFPILEESFFNETQLGGHDVVISFIDKNLGTRKIKFEPNTQTLDTEYLSFKKMIKKYIKADSVKKRNPV